MNKFINWCVVAFLMGCIVVVAVFARSTQLGRLDDCDQFYRLAKVYLYEFDRDLPQVELDKFKQAYGYSPIQSVAYSNLYQACKVRQP